MPDKLRVLLAFAGFAQLVLAGLSLATAGSLAGHATREVGIFELALAVGFLVVAWRPGRAGGLLPVAAVVALLATATSLADVAAGTTSLAQEVGHLLQLVGTGALWALDRRHGRAAPRRGVNRAEPSSRPPARPMTILHRSCAGSRAAAVLVAALMAVTMLVLGGAPASAHASLLETTPSDGQTVDEAPAQVLWTFNEPVTSTSGALRIFDSAGDRVDSGEQTHPAPEQLTVGMREDVGPGSYVATYHLGRRAPDPGGLRLPGR